MVQWINLQRINRFANLTQLHISCEKSGGLHLAELGLTAGSPADKKFRRGSKFQKLAVDQNI